MYQIQKNLNRLLNNQSTFFLDPREQELLKSKLKKNDYSIYRPYKDSEKNIFYNVDIPEVILYEIKCNRVLKHQDILGSIYGLNISSELFGDVLIINGHYYVYVLGIARNYFENYFLKVGNTNIELIERDLSILENYEKENEELELNVSSERIDTIISTLINTSRSIIKDKQKDKEILVNYELVKDISKTFKLGDVFSIKRLGKYKYMGIKKITKSNHYIVIIYKYK